jgi:hypothetical protein
MAETARGMSSSLRRAAPHLRAVGIDVTGGDREAGTGKRMIAIRMIESEAPQQAKPTWEEL